MGQSVMTISLSLCIAALHPPSRILPIAIALFHTGWAPVSAPVLVVQKENFAITLIASGQRALTRAFPFFQMTFCNRSVHTTLYPPTCFASITTLIRFLSLRKRGSAKVLPFVGFCFPFCPFILPFFCPSLVLPPSWTPMTGDFVFALGEEATEDEKEDECGRKGNDETK